MARLWSSGAELNSTTLEGTTTSGTTVAIETTPIRSGTYSYSNTASASAPFFAYQPTSSTTDTSTWFIRVYIYITTLPDADRYVLAVVNSGSALGGGLKITTTGAIQLFQGSGGAGTQVGSNGPTLSTGQWYRLELKIQGTNAGTGELRGLVDGTEFAGSATANTQYVHTVRWGNSGGGNATLDFNFDDIAINDSSGSFQNSWPGEGEIIHLRPNAAGDSNNWAGGDHTDIDEVTPDGGTTVLDSGADGPVTADFNIDATPAAMGSTDIITCVQVGWRFREFLADATDPDTVLRIKASASGTVEESASISVDNTSFATNQKAAPRNYHLTLYDLPGASTTAWTKADLDTTQIGARVTNSPGQAVYIDTMWLLVDHTVDTSTVEQEGFAFGDDDGNEASHTLDTQDTNITEPLGTKTLRMLVDATNDPASIAYKLKYQKNGAGGYADVPIVASTPNPAGPIESGDVTNSGNNTASTTWSISHPAAATGDLLIFNVAWDDSTTTTGLTPPSGPNGETAVVVEDVVASSSTAVRGKVVYYVATGTWSATTIDFTPSASEQWTASVIKVLAGEFDASTPIGAHSNNPSSADTETPASPALSAGASDGGGKVVVWFSSDVDDLNSDVTGWTVLASVDRGAVAGDLIVRDAVASNSESIAEVEGWDSGNDNHWVSFIYIVRSPSSTNNEVYVSASANVTAGGEDTTARLTAPSGKTTSNFTTGRRWDNENGSDSIDIENDEYTELEWVLTTQSPGDTDDYYEFRVYNVDAALDTYTVTPKWTIGTGGGGGTAVKDLIGSGIIPFAR